MIDISENIRLSFPRMLLRHHSWLYDPRSTWSRLYLACVGKVAGRNPKTFSFQEALPRLPVPMLRETCERYLRTVQPLITVEDFARTQAAVAKFQRPGGVGEQLQASLLARARARDNWLLEWWEDSFYHRPRGYLVVNPNWYALGGSASSPMSRTRRAALTISRLLEFKERIDSETLEPQRLYGVVPLCMNQVRQLCSTTRIPGVEKDALVTFGPDESRHVAIICKNQFFWFDAYRDDGSALSPADLEKQLEAVFVLADRSPGPTLAVGLLTAENRTTWAEAREQLLALNPDGIARIEKALFVVCLDQGSPAGLDEHAWAALCGEGGNRWFDKSFQIIVHQGGQMALNAEHACFDGTTGVRMFEYALADGGVFDGQTAGPLPPLNPIQWQTTPEIKGAIERARLNFQELTANVDLKTLAFDHLGKDIIKKRGLSPDGFIQMAIQLAFFKRHGRFALTWEPAHTRTFCRARTATIRTASVQSGGFVKAMERSDCPAGTRYALLQAALAEHGRRTREAMNAQGVDRHLLGLRTLAQEAGMELPSIFRDKAYQLGWTISTAQVPVRGGLGGGIGPETEDGYCIAYHIKKDVVYVHTTSMKSCPDTDSSRLARALEGSLWEMQGVLQGK